MGKWIYNTDSFTPAFRCSNCGHNYPMVAGENVKYSMNFCPNCGVNMNDIDLSETQDVTTGQSKMEFSLSFTERELQCVLAGIILKRDEYAILHSQAKESGETELENYWFILWLMCRNLEGRIHKKLMK